MRHAGLHHWRNDDKKGKQRLQPGDSCTVGLVGTSPTGFCQCQYYTIVIHLMWIKMISGNEAEGMPSLCGAELSLLGTGNAFEARTIDQLSGKMKREEERGEKHSL